MAPPARRRLRRTRRAARTHQVRWTDGRLPDHRQATGRVVPRPAEPRRLRPHPRALPLSRRDPGARRPAGRWAEHRLRGDRPSRRARQRRPAVLDLGGQERRYRALHLRRCKAALEPVRERARQPGHQEGRARLRLHGPRAGAVCGRLRHPEGRLRDRPALLGVRAGRSGRPAGGRRRDGADHLAGAAGEGRR